MTENQIQPIQNTTLIPTINSDLSKYSTDDLALLYDVVDQHTHLYKGKIILEARKQLSSNIKFGEWCKSVQTLCLDSQKSMNRYMYLSAFFHDKDMNEISLSACYEISRPMNADVANAVYEKVKNHAPSVAEVLEVIQEEKLARGIPVEIQKDSSVIEDIPNSESDSSVIEDIPDPESDSSVVEAMSDSESEMKQVVEKLLDKTPVPLGAFTNILIEYYDYCFSLDTKSEPKLCLEQLIRTLQLIEDDEWFSSK